MGEQKNTDLEKPPVGGIRLNELLYLRAALCKFFLVCEEKLRENDDKNHWGNMPITYLTNRLYDELRELSNKVKNRASCEEVVRECADIANFAMMVADIYDLDEI